VALVTGASQGFGAAFSHILADNGADVIALARRMPELDHPNIHPVSGDVTDAPGLKLAIDGAVQKLGRLDIVIANAGIFNIIPFEDMSVEQWRHIQHVNVEGAAFTIQAALPHLKQSGGGRVVLVSSGSIYIGVPNLSAYVTSKAAMIGMARTLAAELAPWKIGVNAITPGLVRTEGVEGTEVGDMQPHIVGMQLVKRPMVTDDLATTILFLASVRSEAVTGQTINVDGGVAKH